MVYVILTETKEFKPMPVGHPIYPRRAWTSEDLDELRRMHPDHSNQEIALKLGRTIEAISLKAMALRLTRTREQISINRSTINVQGLALAEKLTDVDAAYLAGIIDGEGCITVAFTRGYCMNWSITIYNNSRVLMDWIAVRLNCPIHEKRKVGRQLPGFFIRINGNQKVRDLLKKILPHLVIKRDQAVLALEPHYALTGDERVAVVARIRELNSNNRWVHLGTGANSIGRATNYSR